MSLLGCRGAGFSPLDCLFYGLTKKACAAWGLPRTQMVTGFATPSSRWSYGLAARTHDLSSLE